MTIKDEVEQALIGRLRVDSRGVGEVVTLPFAMSTGNFVQVYVERVSEDAWFLSDSGVAAAELALAGVNLDSNRTAHQSWSAVRRSLKIGPALFRDDVHEFDIAGLAEGQRLGRSIVAVGEAMVRAEALRALAPGYKRRQFRDVIIQAAGRHHLPVVPDAPMPTKHNGTRRVSLMIATPQSRYVQAVSGRGRSPQESFDLAQSILTSAAVPPQSLAIVLEDSVRLASWQSQTLEEHAAPVRESDLDAFMLDLVA